MAISIERMRDELLPGLDGLRNNYDMIPRQWSTVFWSEIGDPTTWSPSPPAVSLPVAVAAGVAATIIRNPVVTRRWWDITKWVKS